MMPCFVRHIDPQEVKRRGHVVIRYYDRDQVERDHRHDVVRTVTGNVYFRIADGWHELSRRDPDYDKVVWQEGR
jgi:hypothetical protein